MKRVCPATYYAMHPEEIDSKDINTPLKKRLKTLNGVNEDLKLASSSPDVLVSTADMKVKSGKVDAHIQALVDQFTENGHVIYLHNSITLWNEACNSNETTSALLALQTLRKALLEKEFSAGGNKYFCPNPLFY